MDPRTYTIMAALAAGLPPVVDEAIKPYAKTPRALFLYTILVGSFFAGLASMLSQFALGAVGSEAFDVGLYAMLSGITAGVVNAVRMPPVIPPSPANPAEEDTAP